MRYLQRKINHDLSDMAGVAEFKLKGGDKLNKNLVLDAFLKGIPAVVTKLLAENHSPKEVREALIVKGKAVAEETGFSEEFVLGDSFERRIKQLIG